MKICLLQVKPDSVKRENGKLRITGGSWRGRTVKCPPGIIRPAMDRMRESMFAILGDITGVKFLDLFAGSGVISLEALSRGAEEAMLVEKDGSKRRVIMENLNIALKDSDFCSDEHERPPQERVKLVIRPVERVLKPGLYAPYDIVHLDPPFPRKNKEKLLEMANEAGQPAVNGTLMIHYPSEDTLPESVGSLELYDRRSYGRSLLAFYTRK